MSFVWTKKRFLLYQCYLHPLIVLCFISTTYSAEGLWPQLWGDLLRRVCSLRVAEAAKCLPWPLCELSSRNSWSLLFFFNSSFSNYFRLAETLKKIMLTRKLALTHIINQTTDLIQNLQLLSLISFYWSESLSRIPHKNVLILSVHFHERWQIYIHHVITTKINI